MSRRRARLRSWAQTLLSEEAGADLTSGVVGENKRTSGSEFTTRSALDKVLVALSSHACPSLISKNPSKRA